MPPPTAEPTAGAVSVPPSSCEPPNEEDNDAEWGFPEYLAGPALADAFRLDVARQQCQAWASACGFNIVQKSADRKASKATFPSLTPNTGAYRGIDAGGGQLMLNYRAGGPAAVVSLTQVLNGQVRPEAFQDRVVLVGVTEPSFGDYWTTPFGSGPNEKVPGVLLQAQMVSQILSAVLDGRSLLWSWSEPVEILWIVAWGSVGGLLGWKFKSMRWWLFSLSLTAGVLAIACFGLLLQAGWVPLVPPLLALVMSSTAVRTVDRHSGEILSSSVT